LAWRSLLPIRLMLDFCRQGRGFPWRQYSLHVSVVGVVVLLALLPTVTWPNSIISLPREQYVVFDRAYLEEAPLVLRGERASPPIRQVTVLLRAGVVRTTAGQYPQWEPFTYRVQRGDTVSGIAASFDLSQRTVIWANEGLAKRPDLLPVGQELVILPVDGAYHTVAEGETLQSIAEKYKVSPGAILSYEGNDIPDPDHLDVGAKLIVPGAVLPDLPRKVATPDQPGNLGKTYEAKVVEPVHGSGALAWPLSGTITQGYTRYHEGVDIHTPAGRPVYAADDGTVVLVSWMRGGYGYHVIVNHGDGLETLYAHLSSIDVEVGQKVAKGAEVGKVGSTGRSTGPHLHFEVRENGVRRNPFSYLP